MGKLGPASLPDALSEPLPQPGSGLMYGARVYVHRRFEFYGDGGGLCALEAGRTYMVGDHPGMWANGLDRIGGQTAEAAIRAGSAVLVVWASL